MSPSHPPTAALAAAMVVALLAPERGVLPLLPPLLRPAAAQMIESAAELEAERELATRCKAARRPGEYGPIDSLPVITMNPCMNVTMIELLGNNIEVGYVTVLMLSENAQLLLMVQRKGPVHQLDVQTDGDRAHFDFFRPPARTFRGHSCLNVDQFCDISSVLPTLTGFYSVDRHRVMKFSHTWQPETMEQLKMSTGSFNTHTNASQFSFPTTVAMYAPYNETYLTATDKMLPFHYHASNHFIFIADTGNHRILVINSTSEGQFDEVCQFGVTGASRHDHTGLDWPYSLVVNAPAAEWHFAPAFANVFVADRRNNRIVKLSLGYSMLTVVSDEPDAEPYSFWDWDHVTLTYSGSYGGVGSKVKHEERVNDPVTVAKFRHYIFVGEANGNAVTVLKVHHEHYDQFIFVTRLYPVPGVQLTGNMGVSPPPLGYVWYTYIDFPNEFGIGSIFLDEALRESPPQDPLKDIAAVCVNETWYMVDLVENATLYVEHLGYLLNLTGINWLFPEMEGFFDIWALNITGDQAGVFDVATFNHTVFKGRLVFCPPPTTTSAPAMLSGNTAGWVNSDGSGGNFGAAMRRSGRPLAAASWLVAAAAVLAIGQAPLGGTAAGLAHPQPVPQPALSCEARRKPEMCEASAG